MFNGGKYMDESKKISRQRKIRYIIFCAISILFFAALATTVFYLPSIMGLIGAIGLAIAIFGWFALNNWAKTGKLSLRDLIQIIK
jgi:hypothetical protein